MATLFKLLLLPVTGIIGSITSIRRFLYKGGYISNYRPPVQVINIGNLRLGGTGKTPLVEFLVHKFTDKSNKVAVLSRGYKRKTQGYIKVVQSSVVDDVGDEALQLFKKLGPHVAIHVCENRVTGIKRILADEPGIEMILLDDGFQHLSVKPSLNILLTTYDQPYFRDHIIPLGGLRESRSAANGADITVVTKCPHDLELNQAETYTSEIRYYSPGNPVVFSRLTYLEPITNNKEELIGKRIVLLTGIANHRPIIDHVINNYELLRHFHFADHHYYTVDEVNKIVRYCSEKQCCLLTTSKDIVKLMAFESLKSIPVFVQPVEMQFLFDGENILREMITANQ